MINITLYDPPSGWMYGFPKQYLPLPGESIEDTLRRDGYPELELRYWKGNVPCSFFDSAVEDKL